VTVGEPAVVVIGAGYDGKRCYYEWLGVLTFVRAKTLMLSRARGVS